MNQVVVWREWQHINPLWEAFFRFENFVSNGWLCWI